MIPAEEREKLREAFAPSSPWLKLDTCANVLALKT
jgi:hypothetical protein